ncbi:MAG TPA: DUF1272 domain-containing protein [Xanthomonadales bacterium]|nr:DUF1272 domain-containing protein [Xanthomonadales bacterium]
MLKMKPSCQRCADALRATGIAYICSFECSFCAKCATELGAVCPNCQGELVRRPTRERAPTQVVATTLWNAVSGIFK